MPPSLIFTPLVVASLLHPVRRRHHRQNRRHATLLSSIPLLVMTTLVANNANHCHGFILHPSSSSMMVRPPHGSINHYDKRRYDGDKRYPSGYQPNHQRRHPSSSSRTTTLSTSSSDDDIIPSTTKNASSSNTIGTWNVSIRRSLSVLSIIGVVETSYLTLTKYVGDGSVLLCGASAAGGTTGGCGDVLNGPYATIHWNGMDVPLSLLGLFAYGTVSLLLLSPIDTPLTRSSLLFLTTVMSTISLFLISLLFFVLHASCPYCLLSASLSLALAGSLGILDVPKVDKRMGAGGVLAGITASLLFFASAPSPPIAATAAATANNAPPTITTVSSERALALGKEMNDGHATMYGAFWCSHCYDQKQTLGKEVFEKYVSYVECDGEGRDSQRALCKEKDVPGYPTWEIWGKLYPGERSLDELEELVREIRDK